jgi:hypothetical protein
MIMSGNYKKQPRTFNPKPQQAQPSAPQVEELEEEAKWNPTPEVFEAFLVRDRKLAAGNIAMVLGARNTPTSLKELKDSTLHSSECLEEVLSSHVAQGLIVENKGRYSLGSRTAR